MDRLKGTLSKPIALSGRLSNQNSLSATLSMKTIGSDYPEYSGDTVVVPSLSDQMLSTANTIVKTDILVKEIPTFETSNEFGVSFIIAS